MPLEILPSSNQVPMRKLRDRLRQTFPHWAMYQKSYYFVKIISFYLRYHHCVEFKAFNKFDHSLTWVMVHMSTRSLISSGSLHDGLTQGPGLIASYRVGHGLQIKPNNFNTLATHWFSLSHKTRRLDLHLRPTQNNKPEIISKTITVWSAYWQSRQMGDWCCIQPWVSDCLTDLGRFTITFVSHSSAPRA